MFYIYLNDVEFMATHGVLDFEKAAPQKFIVDAKIETDAVVAAGRTDDLSKGISYVDIYEVMKKIMEDGPFDLIETLAYRIGEAIVDEFTAVISAQIKVTKVNPPIHGYCGTVAVEYVAYGEGSDHA